MTAAQMTQTKSHRRSAHPAPGLGATVATLWGLRWAELAGRRGKLLSAGIVAWIALSSLAVATAGDVLGAGTAVSMLSGLFFVWALAPFIGAGSTEVASRERLVAFPVDPRAMKWANWAAASLDVPVMLGAGVVIGASYSLAGPAGIAAAAMVVVAGTGLGQITAAASGLAVSRWGWRGAGVTAGTVIAGLSAVAFTGSLQTMLNLMPGAWVRNLGDAVATDNLVAAGMWMVALVALVTAVAIGLRWMPVAAGSVEDTGKSVRSKVNVPSSAHGAQWFAVWVSVLRAPTTRLLLIGSQVAPFFIVVSAAFAADGGRIDIVGSAVALGVLATIGVNMFSYLGGGASLLAPDSVSARQCLRAFGVLLFALVVISASAASITTAALGVAELTFRGFAVALAVAAAGTGLAMWWSIRRPAVCDHGSLRSRPAPLRSSAMFALYITVLVITFDVLSGFSLAAVAVISVAAGARWWWKAERRLRRNGPADVVMAVRT